ncbi:protein LYK5-like [Setaria italica]|uniref:protein LYK5-like n=1 Tax=Setaria italica TaxID=4555 RepID=UPI000350B6BD|nr:protein LYK5-like [Setaria italica]
MSVYQAVINGAAAAVKWVVGDVSGHVGILMRVNYSCLVRLLALCVHRGDTYLVFEFTENGALSDWLHGRCGGGGCGSTLRWRQRVNFLLDGDLRTKVSSFRLAHAVVAVDGGAQLTLHVVGTQGYLTPEYLEHGLITPKLDVFAFGVILLELLSRKEAAFADAEMDEEMLLWEAAEEAPRRGAAWPSRCCATGRPEGDHARRYVHLASHDLALAARLVRHSPHHQRRSLLPNSGRIKHALRVVAVCCYERVVARPYCSTSGGPRTNVRTTRMPLTTQRGGMLT